MNNSIFSKLTKVIGIVFLVLVIFTAFYFIVFRRRSQEQVGESEQEYKIKQLNSSLADIPNSVNEKKLAIIGDEYYFQSDLEYFAKQNLTDINNVNKQEAYEWFLEESLILQGAQKEGLISLDSTIFHNPYKNYKRRTEKVVELSNKIESKYVGSIDIEALTIWFCNVTYGQYVEEYGIEAAKELAKSKLEKVRDEVTAGADMKEASQMIKNDSSLAALDPNYSGNAFISYNFTNKIESKASVRDGKGFGRNGLFEFIKNSNPGDISKIYLEEDSPDGEKILDAYYAFYYYKENDLGDSFASLDEWLNNTKDEFKIYNLEQ